VPWADHLRGPVSTMDAFWPPAEAVCQCHQHLDSCEEKPSSAISVFSCAICNVQDSTRAAPRLKLQVKVHRVIEWVGLEGTFENHLVHDRQRAGTASSRPGCSKPRPPNLTLNTSREGTSTALGNLCQCLTTLIVKNVFLTSNLY